MTRTTAKPLRTIVGGWHLTILLLILSAGCASAPQQNSVQTNAITTITGSATPAVADTQSTASFTLSGAINAHYSLHTTELNSELRHNHREFTIIITDQQQDIYLFIAFYGYQGPRSYTLKNTLNGGDVHIGLDKNTRTWDLLIQPQTQCNLIIASDVPSHSANLDRMQGSFNCPQLASSAPTHPQKPITITQGTFDIAMLVAS